MTTQALHKLNHVLVLDECSSWIERVLVAAAEAIAAGRNRRALRTRLRSLTTAQLEDIGLDDPQVQLRCFGAYIGGEGEDLQQLRNRLQAGR